MDEQFEDDFAAEPNGESKENEKKKIIEETASGSQTTPDDVSRGTLHYGYDHEGQGSAETNKNGGSNTASHPQARTEATQSEQVRQDTRSEPQTTPSNTSSPIDEPSTTQGSSIGPNTGSIAPVDASYLQILSPAQPASDNPQSIPENIHPPEDPSTQKTSVTTKEAGASQGASNQAPTEISLSQSSIAKYSDGAVIGKISVADPDAEDVHSFTLSDDRFEVVDGQVKLKKGVSLEHDEVHSLKLEITAIDTHGAETMERFDITIVEMPDVSLATGFQASYFDVDHSLRKLDQIDWGGPATHQEIIDQIDYKNGNGSFWEDGSKDTFGAKITGNIDVEEGGIFNFHVGGDDGVVLFVDGVEIIDNDGLHGFRTRSGEVELEPGTHTIELRYFENHGHAGLKLEWDGPGLDGRELVTAPDHTDMQTVNGMPLTVHISSALPKEIEANSVTQSIEGLPQGTIVQAGKIIVEVDANGSADVSKLDAAFITITPPVDFTGSVEAEIVTSIRQDNGDIVSISDPMSFQVEGAVVVPPTIEIGSGFQASYFDVDHSLRELDQINWESEPTFEEVITEINYANSRASFWENGSKDTFGAKVTGKIDVEEGGSFDFFIGGDDGVVLFVNGVEVIDNDGLHGFRTRSGKIELEPGTHDIEVRYFENYGHAGLKLEWDGPGTNGRELVTATNEIAVEENESTTIRIDIPQSSIDEAITLTGLPADTILVSGDNSVVSKGGELDLTGWNLNLIEISPPLGFEGQISGEVTYKTYAYNGQPVESVQDFSIDVGDVENASTGSSNSVNDDAMIGSHDNDGAGWTSVDGDESQTDEQSEDVMQEQVSHSSEASNNPEQMESYERYDW